MTDQQFRALIECSEIFKAFPKFKQNLTLKLTAVQKLKDYYEQALRHGIDYLKQNPNLTISDVNLIESIL